MQRIYAIFLLTTISIHGFCQSADKLITENEVRRIVNTLAADDMQGRGTFSPGIEKAAKFIEKEFKETGLVPLKGNDGYRQNFTMLRVKPISTDVTINGNKVSADNIAAFGGTSFKWMNEKDVQVVKVTADMNLMQEFMGYMQSGKRMLVIVDPKFASTFNRMQAYSKQISVAFKDKKGQQELVFVLGSSGDISTFSVEHLVKSEELPLFNIAGMIPGKTKPEEYVIFSAHYDHLGIIQAVEKDSIANGADDDASGTTAVLTLAKYFKKEDNNARSLVFVTFTAEELGEHGSEYFAKSINPDNVVAMFNIEMIGKVSKFGRNAAFITGFDRSDFGSILQKNTKDIDFKFYPDPYPSQDLFYRSDNASLAAEGVPAHSISTDQIDNDKLYHSVKDEVATLDIANMTATIKGIAASAKGIISGTDTPTRVSKKAK